MQKIKKAIYKFYDLIFSPLMFISAIIRKDKSYFGIKSPSRELYKTFNKTAYYFVMGMQKSQIDLVKSKFAPYKMQVRQWASPYGDIDRIVRDFEYTKTEYRKYESFFSN